MKAQKRKRGLTLRAASIGAMSAIAGVTFGAGLAPGSAKAASRIPTQTALTSSESSVQPGGSVTITATVKPGVLVTGISSVAFSDTTSGASLGTAKPASRCLLKIKPCPFTLTVPASSLAAGTNTISGTYSGDFLEAPSTGAVTVSDADYDVEGQTTSQCTGSYCSTGTQTSSEGSTELSINASAGPGATITTAFSTTPLPCSTSGVGSTLGDVIVFSATGLTSNKTVDYTVSGPGGLTLAIDYGQTTPHLCYDSPTPFTTADGSPAPPDGDGGYAGLLPSCVLAPSKQYNGTALNPPCFDFVIVDTNANGTQYEVQFETTADDPRASN